MKQPRQQRLVILWFMTAVAGTPQTPSAWQKWLNEDVTYLISDTERAAFKRLHNDEERQEFAVQFWLRRDPTPDTPENEYKEEHYRRIAYADERFASDVPGWKTDRGMVYITFGAPDEIEVPNDGSFQVWRYKYIVELGTNVEIHFVGSSYRLRQDDLMKVTRLLPPSDYVLCESMSQFDQVCVPSPNKLDTVAAPMVQFKGLDSIVVSPINYTALPMSVRTDYLRITPSLIPSPSKRRPPGRAE